jgi:serine/threonine-protein kinase
VALNPGSRVGAYTIEGVLGRGGMGVVYKAADAHGRAVALKLLAREIGIDPESLRRFSREALAAAKIRHENVAQLIETGEHEGLPYLAFELVPGGSLRARLERDGPLPADEVLRLAVPIARGLIAVHAAGVVHRDLKPDNVLAGADGSPKIADFGLVRRAPGRSSLSELGRLTQPGDFLGTPAYMAPEQIQRPDEVDERADLYAFGATLFALLTSRPPFTGEGLVLLKTVLTEPPPRASSLVAVPPALDDLIAALLAKDPAARPASAAAVLAALEAIAAPRGPASEPKRRTPTALVALVVALVLGAAAIGFGAGRSSAGPSQPRPTLSSTQATPTPRAQDPAAAVTSARHRTPEPGTAASPRPGSSASELARFPSFCRGFIASPPTRLKRILGTYRWHVAPARGGTCAFLSDGRPVTGWVDGRLRVLDPRTGEENVTIDVGAPIISLATFRDGKRVLVGLAGATIEAWDLTTQSRLFSLSELAAPANHNVRRIALDRDETTILALASTGHLAAWNLAGVVATLRWKRALSSPLPKESFGGALSPDETTFVTGSADGHVRTFRVSDGEPVHDHVATTRAVHACFFTPDAKHLVAATGEPSLAILDAETGQRELSLPCARGTGSVGTFAAALSIDGRSIATGTDENIELWDLTTRSRVRGIAGHHDLVRELAFSPDGKTLLAASNDGVFRLWDAATGEEARGDVPPFEGRVRALAVSDDARTALVGTSDGRVRVLSFPDGDVAGVLEAEVPTVAVAVSRDGSRALTRGEDGTVRAWDVPAKKVVRSYRGDNGNIGVGFRGDGQPLVALSRTTLALANWDDGATVFTIDDGVRSAEFTADDDLLTASASGFVRLWKSSTGALADSTPKMLSAQVWAGTTKHGILAAGLDRALRLLPKDGLAKTPLWKIETPAVVAGAALSRDGSTAIVLCGDVKHATTWNATSITILDVATGTEAGALDLSASADAPTAVAAIPGSSSVLVGTARGVVLELEVERP